MKYIIFLELLLLSMRGGMTDTSSDANLEEGLAKYETLIRNLLDKAKDHDMKFARQNVKIHNQDRLILEQNVKITNQDRLIMEQNVKIANQDRLIMEHRMSNAVQRNRVLQTQNNLLERSLSTMQQCNDQQQELLSKMARLEALNETVIEYTKHGHEDIQNNIQQWNNKYDELLSQIARLETLNETVMDIVQNQQQVNEVPVIAFGASLESVFTTTESSAKIVFNTIHINEGNSYHNGVFTAPVPGIYVFQWTIVTGHGKHANNYLVVNGQRKRYNIVTSAYYGNFGYKSGSALIPVKLRKGDKVWIIAKDSGYQIAGSGASSFQGWLQSAI